MTPFCCEAPEKFCELQNFPQTIHRPAWGRVREIMAEFSFGDGLIV